MTQIIRGEKLAYQGTANAFAFGSGGHVLATFLCETPEKAELLVEHLRFLVNDERPPWDVVSSYTEAGK